MFNINKSIVFGYVLALVAWFINELIPVRSFLLLTLLLVFFDMIAGMIAANQRGEQITSKAMRRTITKSISYFLVILGAQGFVKVFGVTDYLVFAMSFLIAITEFKSIVENVESITGASLWGKIIELIPQFKKHDTG